MTYAVAVRLQRGLVFAADTRTNAGIDNVSQFRKLHFWRRTGDRVLVLLTAGNLAISQSVISIINEQLSAEAQTDRPTLMNVSSMYRAARLVGDAVREVRAIDGPSLDASKTGFSVSCILGGQLGDEAPRLFQIYDEGNFIEATDDTPYLQIGEHKYGKPILDRVVHPEMRLGEVAKLILLSFDATLRSNLSVGMPIDLLLYERDTLDVRRVRRIDENDDYYRKLSNQWAEALRATVAITPASTISNASLDHLESWRSLRPSTNPAPSMNVSQRQSHLRCSATQSRNSAPPSALASRFSMS